MSLAALTPLAGFLLDLENWVGGMGTRLAEAVEGASDPVALVFFFAAGVLTSLTPCVYPMIPIVVAYMGGAESAATAAGADQSGRRRRIVIRSATYVLGLAIVYTVLGLIAAMLGRVFGSMTQTPWAYGIVGAVIFAFGLSLLGLFEIKVPDFILQKVGTGPREGHVGALIMGATSAIVAAPCAAPIVTPLVAIVAREGRIVFGSIAMFAFSLGLGLLFLILGIFSGAAAGMPRPGLWMIRLKKIMGVVMIILSLYFFYQGYLRW